MRKSPNLQKVAVGGFLKNVVPHFRPSFSKLSKSKKSKFPNFHWT